MLRWLWLDGEVAKVVMVKGDSVSGNLGLELVRPGLGGGADVDTDAEAGGGGAAAEEAEVGRSVDCCGGSS